LHDPEKSQQRPRRLPVIEQLELESNPATALISVAGKNGVTHAMTLLHNEIHANMGLLGINHLSEINPDLLYRHGHTPI